jgi:hypothetical protein
MPAGRTASGTTASCVTAATRTASAVTTAASPSPGTAASCVTTAASPSIPPIAARTGGLGRGSASITWRGIRGIAAIARSGVTWSRITRGGIIGSRAICGRSVPPIRSGGAIAVISVGPLVHDWLVHVQCGPGAAGWRTVTAVRRSRRGSIGPREALPAGCLTSVGVRGLAPGRSVIAKFRLSV